MKNVILLKEDKPNKGTILTVKDDSDFVLNSILDDPVKFLDKHGALGFTRAWALEEINLLGRNEKDIRSVVRVKIFNQSAYSTQTWLIIHVDGNEDMSTLGLFNQLYTIVENYSESKQTS